MKKNHSVLHDIKIASPCKADWNQMTGDEKIRFCQACKLNVYNISQMTTEQAENLIKQKEGRVCVRMYRRRDGTLINQDCPIGRLKKRLATACGAFSAMVSLFVVWVMQGKLSAPPQAVQGEVEMGDIAITGSLAPPSHDYTMGRIQVVQPVVPQNQNMPQELYMGGRHGEKTK